MSLPPSLAGKYQLAIFAAEDDAKLPERASRLDQALAVSFAQLGVNMKKFLVRSMSGDVGPLDRRMPTVGVYFGTNPSPKLSVLENAQLDKLIADGVLVIPIVPVKAAFTSFVPPQIAGLNGVSYAECGAEFERLSSRILEGFGLLRERRRLFVSYRRAETSAVATQIYETLDAAGFDVFLDTHGALRPGEPFQDVLWHRLSDTDVAVILDSPGFFESRWTQAELARANTSNIQILQVLWPGRTEGVAAAFSTFLPLDENDFEGHVAAGPTAHLTEPSLGVIVDAVEGLRARAIGARLAFLVREFVLEAKKVKLLVHATLERALVVFGRSGQRAFVLPAIGVPDAERYESLVRLQQRELKDGRVYLSPPILLYDQTGIRTKWLQHLDWLNHNLECARSVSLQSANGWLVDMIGRGLL